MAMNFSELSGIKQWLAVILGGALVTGALYFLMFKSQNEKNTAAQHSLDDKIRENNELESYRPSSSRSSSSWRSSNSSWKSSSASCPTKRRWTSSSP